MFSLDQKEYEEKLEKIKTKNLQKEYRMSLYQERNKYKQKKIETSKLIAIYLFILLNAIIVYAMVAMWTFADFSYLGVLITDIAAQVIIYAIYCLKAYHGKKQEEYMNFEKDLLKCNAGNDYSLAEDGLNQLYYDINV